MRIITISRQFGSGGREIGQKLAEQLGWDFYDKNIITKLSEAVSLDEQYVKDLLHENQWTTPLCYGTEFTTLGYGSAWQMKVLRKQSEILEEIAKLGHDCVIVGRDADIVLEDYKPFRLYVCADLDYRLKRCMERESKNEGKQLTEKQVLKNIKKVDKKRLVTREMLSGKADNDASLFELRVNASSWTAEALAPKIADFALAWFEQQEK